MCLVEAAPGTPAKVTDLPMTAGRRLRTVRGTVADLAARATSSATTSCGSTSANRPAPGCARTSRGAAQRARDPHRPGVRRPVTHGRAVDRDRTPPSELFADYCAAARRRRRRGCTPCSTAARRGDQPARPADDRDRLLMRPVRLDMDGFAAFREKTTVDFTDADYFALVGPTGAGKSTVSTRSPSPSTAPCPAGTTAEVTPALAPTATRGPSGSSSTPTGPLRRRPGAAPQPAAGPCSSQAPGSSASHDQTDLDERRRPPTCSPPTRQVNAAVEKLLGLTYEHFTTAWRCRRASSPSSCTPSPRPAGDPVHLLGLGVYEVIARRAREEAAGHRATADAARPTSSALRGRDRRSRTGRRRSRPPSPTGR